MDSKERNIWLRYYARRAGSRWRAIRPFFHTLLGALIFTAILITVSRYRISKSMLSSHTFLVEGLVFKRAKNATGLTLNKPVAAIIVEIGGFRTTTNNSGLYKLKFQSEIKQDIPVILRLKGHQVINRVSFGPREAIKNKDFLFQ